MSTTTPFPDVGAPFREGLGKRRLMLQFDRASGRAQFYPRPQSLYGESGVEWREASGRGRIFALTLSRVAPAHLKGEVPYSLALVQLDEGPRMLARIGAPFDQLRPGQVVAVDWDHPDSTRSFPVFKPAAMTAS
jgi:uncharacterized OB-fold protein